MPIEKKSSERIAYEKIRKSIMLRKILPGQRLSEEWISQKLGMSRTPVRAALKQLEQERIIKLIPRRGAFVNDPTDKEIRDVFNVRILLECYAAKMATEIIEDSQIEKLKSLTEKEREAYEKKDFESFIKINKMIHKYPAMVIQNTCLVQQVSSLIVWSDCYLVLKDPFYKRSAETAKNTYEHKMIVCALESRIPEKAEMAVQEHLESTLEGLEERNDSIFE